MVASPENKKQKTGEWKLEPHKTIKPPTKEAPLLLVVLDGWGEAPDADDNAIALAGGVRASAALAGPCMLKRQ